MLRSFVPLYITFVSASALSDQGRRLDAGKVQAFLESRKAPFARSLGNRLSSLSAALRARHSGH